MAKVLAIYGADKKFTQSKAAAAADSTGPSLFGILLDKTNFYAEQGGQEADIGSIMLDSENSEFVVDDVQVSAGYILHVGFLKYGTLNVGDQVICSYDEVCV
jgi:alanyl-tRNA synthetase